MEQLWEGDSSRGDIEWVKLSTKPPSVLQLDRTASHLNSQEERTHGSAPGAISSKCITLMVTDHGSLLTAIALGSLLLASFAALHSSL